MSEKVKLDAVWNELQKNKKNSKNQKKIKTRTLQESLDLSIKAKICMNTDNSKKS